MALRFHFLGDLTVLRDGAVLALPPSRKTRALLAYLILNPRSFNREHLCELLWEIPDDPRGSLRWSLSKLRRLVDDPGRRRIVADRLSVRFDASDVVVDVAALKALANSGLGTASVETLEDAAALYRGNLLEGIELSSLHQFHAWCIAERELASRAQAAVLGALVERLAAQPLRALPHAHALVALAPYDEAARATLIRLLVTLGRADDAARQYELGARMLEEIGAEPTGTLYRALHGTPKSAPAPRQALPTIPAAPASSGALAAQTPPLPQSRSTHRPRPLIGRDAETARLRELLRETMGQPRARVVLLGGEPGIGKSRLLQWIAEASRAADAFLLEASAVESATIRPFALWIDALRGAAAHTARDIFGGRDHENRDRLFGALSDFVAAESSLRPVVLLFDDVQWCDESSASALHYVARMNRDRPLLAILAAREDEIRDNGPAQQALRGLRHDALLEEISVGPLPQADLRRLIETHAPQANSERLCRECAGNPLLAIELSRAEVSGDSAGSLHELIRERLARFDFEGAEVMRWAAVLASRFDPALLQQATGFDAYRVGVALESAEKQGILIATDTGLRFSHDLVARSIYREISPARRRMMHRRAAELLEHDTALDLRHAADLAHHASQSGDPALAVTAMVSAGRLCLRFYANGEALSLARKGLQLAERLGAAARVCATIELREIMLTAAPLEDWEQAAAEFAALAEQALDHGALAHARLGYYMASYVRWMHGHWAGAREEILQAARLTRSGNDEAHIVGMAEAAKCLAMLERDLSQADAMLMEAQALAGRAQLRHHSIPVALGMLRYHKAKLEEAEELFKEARILSKSAGDRVTEFQANEYLVMIEFERGHFDAAKARCAALVEIGDKLRDGSEAPFARALSTLCDYALGAGSASLDAALEPLRLADAKHRLAYALTRAALLDIDGGRLDQAVARAGEALGYAATLGRTTETMLAHVALAEAHMAGGNAAALEHHLEAVASFAESPVADWARARSASLLERASSARQAAAL